MKLGRVSTQVFLTLILILFLGSLIAQQAEMSGSEDVYLAGASVRVLNEVEGDVIIAGGSLTIDHAVSEDVIAAGGTVSITASIGDDVRAAGGLVTINGDIGDDLASSAYSVSLGSGSTVGGNAWLSGRTVDVAGNVKQALKVNGGDVALSGTYGGDVEVLADAIEIGPGAVIKGNLSYRAPREANISDAAVIEGEVIRQEVNLTEPETWIEAALGSLKFYLSLALCSIVLFLLYPKWFGEVVQELSAAPFQSLGLGFVVLVVTPVLAILLLFSVLGVPLGLIALTVFLATLIAGLLVGMVWVGDAGFRLLGQKPNRSKWARVWSIFAAAAVLMLIGFIPYVGGWVFFTVLLLGIGAMKRYFYKLYIGQPV